MKALRPVPKPEKPTSDPAYLADVRTLPCVCCGRYPSAAHHPIMGRFAQRRSSDRDAIPLCFDHHQGVNGLHTSPDLWRARYGFDTDHIDRTREAVAKLRRELIGGRR